MIKLWFVLRDPPTLFELRTDAVTGEHLIYIDIFKDDIKSSDGR